MERYRIMKTTATATKDVNIALTQEEATAIVQILRQVPTGAGVWPLLVKIEQQYKDQTDQTPDSK